MAFMIPESLSSAPAPEIEAFQLLRRSLPDEYAVWHRSALELAEDDCLPFLALSERGGVLTIHPAALPQDGAGPAALKAHLDQAGAAHRSLLDLLRDTEDPALLAGSALRPAAHCISLLTNVTAREIGQQGLRGLSPDVLILGKDEAGQLTEIVQGRTPGAGQLTSDQFNAIRRVVSPGIAITLPRPPQAEAAGEFRPAPAPRPLLDLRQEQAVKSFADLPADQEGLTRDLDTRMVRGVAGSGKTLILLHRAHFLAQRFPNWRILVLTYNRALAGFLEARYRDFPERSNRIEITTFYKLARAQLNPIKLWQNALDDWERDPIIQQALARDGNTGLPLDIDYLRKELDWIADIGITTLDAYLEADRRGRKQRLTAAQRQAVWRVRDFYLQRLKTLGRTDWPAAAATLCGALQDGRLAGQQYDAILIDEAQDFAPIWFTALLRMLRPATNMLFLAADSAQKLYERPLSWRALGIDLTGNRSRVLKRSYRNTFEILRAANEVILGNADVAQELKAEGDELIQPDLIKLDMRGGPLPILWWTRDQRAQIDAVIREIRELRSQFKYDWDDFAVFAKTTDELNILASRLQASGIPQQLAKSDDVDLSRNDVKLVTLHSSKGLEFTVVFILDVDRLQPAAGLTGEDLAVESARERRLLYVGMTRSRERLYLLHSNSLPVWIGESLRSIERR